MPELLRDMRGRCEHNSEIALALTLILRAWETLGKKWEKIYLDNVSLSHLEYERLVVVANVIYLLWNEQESKSPLMLIFWYFFSFCNALSLRRTATSKIHTQ